MAAKATSEYGYTLLLPRIEKTKTPSFVNIFVKHAVTDVTNETEVFLPRRMQNFVFFPLVWSIISLKTSLKCPSLFSNSTISKFSNRPVICIPLSLCFPTQKMKLLPCIFQYFVVNVQSSTIYLLFLAGGNIDVLFLRRHSISDMSAGRIQPPKFTIF